jgi:hypothetical protein
MYYEEGQIVGSFFFFVIWVTIVTQMTKKKQKNINEILCAERKEHLILK